MSVTTKGRTVFVFGAVVASSLLLSACGDSGGSGAVSVSPVTYTGITTAAVIDNEAAAVKFSETAVSGDLPSSGGFMAGVSTGSVGDAPFVERLRSIADSVMGMDYTSLASVTVAGATANDVEQGCAGSASGTVNYDDLNGNGAYDEDYDRLLSASVTYSNYKALNNDGSCSTLTVNGSATLVLFYEDPSNDTRLTSMNVTTPALATTDATGATETMTGSFIMSMMSSGVSFTLSADYRDASGAVYRAKDYKVVISYLYGVTSVDGILCDPVEGCIEIVTTTAFNYDPTSCSYPITGALTIYGYDLDAGTRTSGYITVDAWADNGGCSTYQVCWNGATSACLVPDPTWY